MCGNPVRVKKRGHHKIYDSIRCKRKARHQREYSRLKANPVLWKKETERKRKVSKAWRHKYPGKRNAQEKRRRERVQADPPRRARRDAWYRDYYKRKKELKSYGIDSAYLPHGVDR